MNLISRHLPQLHAEDSRVPLLGKAILLAILAMIGYWIYSSPLKATIGLGAFAVLVGGAMVIDARRIARIRRERDDSICDFRRSFVRSMFGRSIHGLFEQPTKHSARGSTPSKPISLSEHQILLKII